MSILSRSLLSRKRVALLACGALLALGAGSWRKATQPGDHAFHQENVLGTSFALQVQGATPAAAAQAEAAALAEIDRLQAKLSSYDEKSEFRRWAATQGEAVAVSPELFAVLAGFDQWRGQTLGILNPAAQAGLQLWKEAARTGQEPAPAALASAVRRMNQPHWQLDPARQTARRLTAEPLVMNSFVKSFIAGRAAEAAQAALGEQARQATVVLNLGGDLVVRGSQPHAIRIADPQSAAENGPALSRIAVAGCAEQTCAIATSGHYRRGLWVNGKWHSHILDPRTGQTAAGIASATIAAPDPVAAGALATALTVLPLAEAEALLHAVSPKVPGLAYLLVSPQGEQRSNLGWQKLEALARATQAAAAPVNQALAAGPAPASWDPAYELEIQLELGRPDGGRYKRPFVAVWVEDQDKFPLRTIALWYDRPRWLPDLRLWYKQDRLRSLAEGNEIAESVASATRPSGKYTLRWDGKDSKGHYLKPGKYTICLEAAREHGTYQIIRQELVLPLQPKSMPLPGNLEISSASLSYHKAAGK